jgi:hypothetical protein
MEAPNIPHFITEEMLRNIRRERLEQENKADCCKCGTAFDFVYLHWDLEGNCFCTACLWGLYR